MGKFLHSEVFVGVLHDLNPATLRVVDNETVVGWKLFERHDFGCAVGEQLLHGGAGVGGYPADMVIAATVVRATSCVRIRTGRAAPRSGSGRRVHRIP